MKRILFQGDSITDVGRAKDGTTLGGGYPLFVSARVGVDALGEYEFINRGISGNRVTDLYARIKSDVINLAPDYMSVLIGVNDVWHELDVHNGVDAAKYEKIYDMFIDEIVTALPDIKIMILGPYVLPEKGTTGELEDGSDKFERFSREVALRADAAKRIADKHGLVYVPLQCVFDEAAKSQPVAYWSADGVHPTQYGHELIAREWVKAFNEKLK